jgi:hypothetical protein
MSFIICQMSNENDIYYMYMFDVTWICTTSIQTEICRNVFLDKSSGWKSYDEYSQRIGKF